MLACTYRFDKYEALGLAVELHKAASLFEVRCFFEVLLSLYEGIAVGCEKFFAL